MGRNILINSQRKRILFISNDKRKGNKTEEKQKKNMQKENITDGSDFSENEIPDLNSLKPFEFEPKKSSKTLTLVAVMMRKKVWKIK